MVDGFKALTEKEKQTLRLMGRGQDAKSMARHLGISVHTVNERLRFARRKMAVTSSREAARILLDQEEAAPKISADETFGDASPPTAADKDGPSSDGRGRRPAFVLAGALAMSLVLAAFAFLGMSAQNPPATGDGSAATAPDPAVADAARSWLALVDAGDWGASYQTSGSAFQRVNSDAQWTAASEKARLPLGAVRSRVLLDQQHLLAPPHGYEMLRFRTAFAAAPNATETVTLERQGSTYRVVSYVID